jgi:hypothetical protein
MSLGWHCVGLCIQLIDTMPSRAFLRKSGGKCEWFLGHGFVRAFGYAQDFAWRRSAMVVLCGVAVLDARELVVTSGAEAGRVSQLYRRSKDLLHPAVGHSKHLRKITREM